MKLKTVNPLRDKISAAAQELYLREGAAGFSMRRVAEIVGVSAPAIYRHYKNKEELLNEIVIEGLKILEGYLRPAFEADSPYERLVRMTRAYLSFALEQPKYFDFAFLTPSLEISNVDEEITRPDWGTFRLCIDEVAACMEQGVFVQGDPLATSITIWAEVHGLVTLHRTGRFGRNPETFRRLYGESVDRLLKGLMPPDAASSTRPRS